MQSESSIGVTNTATPDSGTASAVVDSPSTNQGSGVPSGQSLADVQSQPVQGQQTDQQSAPQDDVLAGIPTPDELKALVEQKIPHAEGLARIRSAYEAQKTQFNELTQQYEPFKPLLERFEKPEALQELVKWNDTLFGVERDERGQLVPATQTFAQDLAARDPNVADFLTADLLNGLTRTDDGREIPRIDLALEAMAQDPTRRAMALRILGGVEPASIAPTWQPSQEELAVVTPDLQDIYRQLPYDEREALKLNDPAFINNYLGKEKFQADLIAANQQAQQLQLQQQQQREQYVAQQAANAGNQYLEQQFRAGLTEFTNRIVEKATFIAPIDAETAKTMPPEQVAAFNNDAKQVNEGMGRLIAVVSAAMSVPDVQWMMVDFLKGQGVDDATIQSFDNARKEFANNARNYGELSFQTNGQPHAGLGTLQSNTSRAMREMKGRASAVSQPLMKLVSKMFEMKAGNYQNALDNGAVARPPTNGSRFDPTTAPAQLPVGGTMTRAEIERLYG